MCGRHPPPHSFADKPVLPTKGWALVRSCDGRCWQTVVDLRGEVAYCKDTGSRMKIDFVGSLPIGLTLLAPTSRSDNWDGQKWVHQDNQRCHCGTDPETPNSPLSLQQPPRAMSDLLAGAYFRRDRRAVSWRCRTREINALRH
ncbi:hypothetical protein [Sodalis sp. (in: enterobacteria)]|uniref:hypothetical protein n=1 Tax=Sodalis sp. (in: enterobacteria) TaxID=1898979 RepID=UPI003F3BF104